MSTRTMALALAAVAIVSGCAKKETTHAKATTTGSPVVSGGLTKPEVTIPEGSPPTTLQTEDITVGTGAEATAGKTISVQYVGVAWSTRKEFDSSWSRGQPATFRIGVGQLIKGWDQGIVGMREGGRRKLIVPPDLGYGAQGSPPAIEPNETLVFVVDLIKVF